MRRRTSEDLEHAAQRLRHRAERIMQAPPRIRCGDDARVVLGARIAGTIAVLDHALRCPSDDRRLELLTQSIDELVRLRQAEVDRMTVAALEVA